MELAFYIVGIASVVTTVLIFTQKQPMYALLFLIISVILISFLFFLLGSSFAGALEIIIYAGAVMVLFVFVVMTLNVSTNSSNQIRTLCFSRSSAGSVCFLLALLALLVYSIEVFKGHNIAKHNVPIKSVGTVLFGPYLLLVELASMLLLAGLLVSFHLGRSDIIKHS